MNRATSARMLAVLRSGRVFCASLLAALCLAALVACGGAAQPSPADAVSADYGGGKPVLDATGAAAALPSNTLFLATARSPRALAASLRVREVLRAYGDFYQELAGEVSRRFGANLLDPNGFAEIGLDPEGRFGLAILDGGDDAFTFFATLADRDRFEAAARGPLSDALGELESRALGDALAYTSEEDELSLILRGDRVFLLITDDEDDHETLLARIAVGQGRDTLAGDPSFQRAFEGFDFGADVAAYVALPAIVRQIQRHDARWQEEHRERLKEQVRQLEAAVASAKDSGVDEAELERLRSRLERERKWLQRTMRREEGERRFFRELFEATGGIALGAELEGPTLRLKASVRPEPGSLGARLLRPGEEPHSLLSALEEPPLFALAGHTDPDALVELAELILQMDGDDAGELSRAFREASGLDLRGQVLPLLSGEAGFAFDATVDLDAERPDVDFTVLLGLRDPEAGRRLIEEAADSDQLSSFARQGPEGPGLALPLPRDRRVFIDVVGDQVTVSTEDEVARRLSPESSPDLRADLSEREASLLEDPRLGAFLLLDPTLLFWLGASFSAKMEQAGVAAETAPPPKKSEEVLRLEEELEETRRKLDDYRDRLQRARMELILDRSRLLGRTVAVAHPSDEAIVAVGGLFTTGADLGEALQAIVEMIEPELLLARDPSRGEELRRLRKERDALREERDALRDELRDARNR